MAKNMVNILVTIHRLILKMVIQIGKGKCHYQNLGGGGKWINSLLSQAFFFEIPSLKSVDYLYLFIKNMLSRLVKLDLLLGVP